MIEQIRFAVVEVVHQQTLYDPTKLLPEVHLEGELGIDSVLLSSIKSSLRERFRLAKDTLGGAPSTLRDLVDQVVKEIGSTAPAPKPAGALSTRGLAMVTDAVVRPTRYPKERITPDADLEGELGVDSVMLTAICRDLAEALRLPPRLLDPARIRTVRDIASLLGETAPAVVSAEPVAPEGGSWRDRAVPPDHKNGNGHARLPAGSARPLESFPGPRDRPLPDDERRRLCEVIERELGIGRVLRLDDCDTIEKLEAYVRAAGADTQLGERAPSAAEEEPWDERTLKDFVERRDPDLFAKAKSFREFYERKAKQEIYWYGMALESPCRNRAVIHDAVGGRRREYLMFASNNYLGLANDPRVIEAIRQSAAKYGSTNTGCRLIGGTNVLHKELEERLARFKNREACIVYPSGYSANLGCISALVKRHDAVVVDKLNHMSITDGCKLSGGAIKIYQHNDMSDLERVLERASQEADGILIATDGVFSMHGDIADLPEISRIAKKYRARVLVDDAHSTGVLGRRGSGTAEHFGLKGEIDLELGTMSKTLAGLGGFVCGDEEVIDYLRFYSNSYVFAANIPACVAAGLIASIDVIEREPERIERLWTNIKRLQHSLLSEGFDLGGANSAIIPVVIGDDRRTLELGRAVRSRGMFCQTVVYPGVSLGDGRLRISVTSEHTAEDLDLAAEIITDAAREVGVHPRRLV